MGFFSKLRKEKKGQEAVPPAAPAPAGQPAAPVPQQMLPPSIHQPVVPAVAHQMQQAPPRRSGRSSASGRAAPQYAAVPSPQPVKTQEQQLQDATTAKQEKLMEAIGLKRKEVDRVDKVIQRHESERKQIATKALEAQKAKRQKEAERLAKQALRLKKRIENYDNQLHLLQEQLGALEDAGANMNFAQQVKSGTETLNEVKVDQDDLEDALADARESIMATQEATDALKVDVGMYGDTVDTEDLLAELNEEYATEAIPDVPLENPKIPDELQTLQASVEGVHIGSSSAHPAQRQVATPAPRDEGVEALKSLEAEIGLN